jgi:hypothetical protein
MEEVRHDTSAPRTGEYARRRLIMPIDQIPSEEMTTWRGATSALTLTIRLSR